MKRTHRFVFAMCLVCSSLGAYASERYSPPRAADGHPLLEGTWTNASLTTLERNKRYDALVIPQKDIERVTAEHPQAIRQRTDDGLADTGPLLDGSDLKSGRGYNAFWTDPGVAFGIVKGEHRTSWIVDPADGRMPYTPDARRYIATLHDNFDGPEGRPLGERCLAIGDRVGPPMVNGLYNNNYQIVQAHDRIVILVEMIEHARVIRLHSEHAPAAVRPLFGDSIGRWEGDSLVVETTNFSPMHARSGHPAYLSAKGKVLERFTRVARDRLLYEFTVTDPEFYTQPWRGEMTFNAASGRIYEYACHEGNYALTGVLAGARAEEHNTTEKKAAP